MVDQASFGVSARKWSAGMEGLERDGMGWFYYLFYRAALQERIMFCRPGLVPRLPFLASTDPPFSASISNKYMLSGGQNVLINDILSDTDLYFQRV